MKKLLLFLFLLVSVPSYSQYMVSGIFYLPDDVKFLVVDWDFSNTLFDLKYNEKEWAALHGEKEWEEAKSEALELILREMNSKLKNSRITAIPPGNSLNQGYTLYICPIKLKKNGDNSSDYVLKDNNSEIMGSCRVKGDGGRVGSLGNLLGDGYEEAAKRMGKFLKTRNHL